MKYLHFGAKCREFTSVIWGAMVPGANWSERLSHSALFATSGSLVIRRGLPSFCLKIHVMRKMPVMTWTGNIFAEKRFAWKWLVGQAGEEELPELDSQKSAMNAAGSDIMPELALVSGDREVAEIAAMAAAAIEEIGDVAPDPAALGEYFFILELQSSKLYYFTLLFYVSFEIKKNKTLLLSHNNFNFG